MYYCLAIQRIGVIRLFMSLMFLFTVSHHSSAKEPDNQIDGFAYQLSIKDRKINLNAENASLKRIIEAIGKEMDIEVEVRIPEEKRITIQFKDQELEEAFKLMKVNYALVTDTKEKYGNIKRIIVVPEGQQAQLAMSASGKFDQQAKIGIKQETGLRSEPFKFEFDPSRYK